MDFELVITAAEDADHAVVSLRGELDAATCVLLSQAVHDTKDRGYTTIRCDLSRLTFCDAAGVTCLLAVQEQLTALGGGLTVDGALGIVRKLLTITDTLGTLS